MNIMDPSLIATEVSAALDSGRLFDAEARLEIASLGSLDTDWMIGLLRETHGERNRLSNWRKFRDEVRSELTKRGLDYHELMAGLLGD